MALPNPWGSDDKLKKTSIYIISESFHVNMSSYGSVVLEKILK
jgi:hypothetical protein